MGTSERDDEAQVLQDECQAIHHHHEQQGRGDVDCRFSSTLAQSDHAQHPARRDWHAALQLTGTQPKRG